MEHRRKTDEEVFSKYCPNRFCKDGAQWYFATREGTLEGPYQSMTDAETGLGAYLKLMASGFMPKGTTLAIEPLDAQGVRESSPLH